MSEKMSMYKSEVTEIIEEKVSYEDICSKISELNKSSSIDSVSKDSSSLISEIEIGSNISPDSKNSKPAFKIKLKKNNESESDQSHLKL